MSCSLQLALLEAKQYPRILLVIQHRVLRSLVSVMGDVPLTNCNPSRILCKHIFVGSARSESRWISFCSARLNPDEEVGNRASELQDSRHKTLKFDMCIGLAPDAAPERSHNALRLSQNVNTQGCPHYCIWHKCEKT